MELSPEQLARENSLRSLIAAGGNERVTVNGKDVFAFVEDLTSDEVAAAGGETDSGGYRVRVVARDFSFEEPEGGCEIDVRGRKRACLSLLTRNRVEYEITAGDPTS